MVLASFAMWYFYIQTAQVEENSLEDTFIASAQSPAQQELLKKHPLDIPLYVEGGFTEWLKYKSATYFILRADADPAKFVNIDPKVEEKKDESKFHMLLLPCSFGHMVAAIS